MKPSAEREESPNRARTASSAAGFGGSAGTIRLSSGLGRRRPRPSRSTSAETIALRALLIGAPPARRSRTEPPPEQQAEDEQRRHGQEPGHEPLWNRPEEAESPPAGAVRPLRELDVADDRVELPVADRVLRELRHHVGPDPHGLRDLERRRPVERRRQRARHVAALPDNLVAARAVLREEGLALREAAELGLRLRDRRAAEACDIGDEGPALNIAEREGFPAGLRAEVAERHVAGAEVEISGESAHALQRRRDPGLLPLVATRSGAGGVRRLVRASHRVAAVAAEAVLAVEVVAVGGERLLRRAARG